MAVFNAKDRIIECKVVYYGSDRGGKTTNLEYIHKAEKKYTSTEEIFGAHITASSERVKMVAIRDDHV